MQKTITSILAVLLFAYLANCEVFFKEQFKDGWEKRWVKAEDTADKKYGKWGLGTGKFYGGSKAEAKGLQTQEDYRFYEISSALDKTVSNKDQDLVLQYSVKHEQGLDCGGGYIKLLPEGLDQKHMNGDSPYSVMFGPDICGATKKIHLIFTYNGQNLLWKKQPSCPSDKLTHLYTLVIHPDNTYEVHVDQEKKESGKLEDDWDFLLPRQIKDPNASKPADWVDEKEIDDPEDKKPEGLEDQPEYIPDEEATKPEDWNDEEDGEWERPQVKNPNFTGEWKARRIPNPAYKGEWVHPLIDNPDFKEDKDLYLIPNTKFVGFDLWQVKSGSIFDNIFLGNSLEEAEKFANETFKKASEEERKKHDDSEAAERKKIEEERKKAEEESKKKQAEEDKKKAEAEEEDAVDINEEAEFKEADVRDEL